MGSLAGAAHLLNDNTLICPAIDPDTYLGIGAWNGIGTGIVGTIGYVVLPTGMSTDVSRDIV